MENINTPDFWDKDFQDEYEGKTPSRWLPIKFLKLMSDFPPKGKVLDVGCGLGHFCRYLTAYPKKYEVYGTDFSPYAIEKARLLGFPSESYQVADAYNQPFEDGFFDVVVAADVVEHLSKPDVFVRELGRITKKGGKIVIATPLGGQGQLHSPEHVREYTKNGLINLMMPVCNEHTFISQFYLFFPDTRETEYDDTIFYSGTKK